MFFKSCFFQFDAFVTLYMIMRWKNSFDKLILLCTIFSIPVNLITFFTRTNPHTTLITKNKNVKNDLLALPAHNNFNSHFAQHCESNFLSNHRINLHKKIAKCRMK